MEFKRPKRSAMDFPMAPMIDCVFLLLIFFMVAAQTRVPPRFPIELPDSLTRHAFPMKRFNLYIGREGLMAIDDKMMLNYDDLEENLIKDKKSIETLVIKADKLALHGWVIDAMERAKRAGIEELAIGVKEQGGGIIIEE
ncbi:MAG: biopolymer transport protein ExbD [Candidatus Poribacteria bacterium]|nr:biopolymer transport protein ExbD [Candidatus Poribacteria bacterium]